MQVASFGIWLHRSLEVPWILRLWAGKGLVDLEVYSLLAADWQRKGKA